MNEQQNDSALLFSRDITQAAQGRAVISKIEDILEDIIDALSENRVLTIPLRSRRSGNENLIRFPTNTSAEVKRFNLFGSQQYVDNLVDDVAFTFGVGRDTLNIGILIPHAETVQQVDIRETRWVLVIEKEATFRGLAASRYYETSAAGAGVLITGKGYPDLVTRQFLHLLHSGSPQVPIYALVDFDPSGIDIMLTYKRGSRSLSHEENITAPGLSWLGPKSSDVLGQINGPPSLRDTSKARQSFTSPPSAPIPSANPIEAFSQLTTLDRRKAMDLLSRLTRESDEDTNENCLINELQLMLMLNLKAEIQVVDDAGNLTGWLDEKLGRVVLNEPVSRITIGTY
ncbi:hypothetical protein ABKA04_001208 [Annulohypoxylon sp. FPYF3050]